MILQILIGLAPFAIILGLFVPPSVFLARWSASGHLLRERNRVGPDVNSGLWASLSCLSHLLLLGALWAGAAFQQRNELMLFVILLMPLPVAANFIAWLLARPIRVKSSKARTTLSMAAGISLLLLAAWIAACVGVAALAGGLALFGAVNLLALGVVNRRSLPADPVCRTAQKFASPSETES